MDKTFENPLFQYAWETVQQLGITEFQNSNGTVTKVITDSQTMPMFIVEKPSEYGGFHATIHSGKSHDRTPFHFTTGGPHAATGGPHAATGGPHAATDGPHAPTSLVREISTYDASYSITDDNSAETSIHRKFVGKKKRKRYSRWMPSRTEHRFESINALSDGLSETLGFLCGPSGGYSGTSIQFTEYSGKKRKTARKTLGGGNDNIKELDMDEDELDKDEDELDKDELDKDENFTCDILVTNVPKKTENILDVLIYLMCNFNVQNLTTSYRDLIKKIKPHTYSLSLLKNTDINKLKISYTVSIYEDKIIEDDKVDKSIDVSDAYKQKYIKYKQKYLNLKNNLTN